MNQKTVLIIALVVVVILCICAILSFVLFGGSIAAIFSFTKPAADQGDAFMQALSDSNYEAALSLCTQELQHNQGSADTLRTNIEGNGLQPEKWSFNSTNVTGSNATLQGSVTFMGSGRQGTVKISLTHSGDRWLVSDFLLKP